MAPGLKIFASAAPLKSLQQRCKLIIVFHTFGDERPDELSRQVEVCGQQLSLFNVMSNCHIKLQLCELCVTSPWPPGGEHIMDFKGPPVISECRHFGNHEGAEAKGH